MERNERTYDICFVISSSSSSSLLSLFSISYKHLNLQLSNYHNSSSIKVVVFGLASVSFRSHLAPSAFNYIATRPGLGRHNLRALVFLGTISWCLLFSLSTDILGLSIEFGAFASGIYLAGMSNVQDISEMMDAVSVLMGSLYFASVGMILNLEWMYENFWSVLGMALMVTVVKILAAMIILMFTLKLSSKSAMLAGVALAQVGDFSLVFISKTHRLDLINRNLYLHMLTSIVIMMVVLPYMLRYLHERILSSELGAVGSRVSAIELGETKMTSSSSSKSSSKNGGGKSVLPVVAISSTMRKDSDDRDLHEL